MTQWFLGIWGTPCSKLSFNSGEWSMKENYPESFLLLWQTSPSQRKKNPQTLWWIEAIWHICQKENATNQPNQTKPNETKRNQTNPTQPNPTQPNNQPNPTQPNPTQPNPTKQTIKFSVGPSVGNAHCFDCVLKADSRALMLSHTVVTCWSLMGQLNLYTPPQLLQVVASAGDKLFHLLNTRGL